MPSEVGLIGDFTRSLWPRIDEAAGRKVEAALTVFPPDAKRSYWMVRLQGAGFQIRVEADTAEEAGDLVITTVKATVAASKGESS